MASILLTTPTNEAIPLPESGEEPGHHRCAMLDTVFRGSLCENLAKKGRAHRVLRGEFVHQTGDPARSVLLLRRGVVKTAITSKSGRELILQVYKAQDLFGELCFCGGRRQENAIAMEDSEYVEISFDDLIAHLQSNRPALTNFLGTICDRLASAYAVLSSRSFERTEYRLVKTLVKLAEEFGESSPQGKIIGHYIKQEELAAMIGAPREMVSSLLTKFRRRGLITYLRRGHLTVNTDALLAYIRPDADKAQPDAAQ